jgi:hypothetical protein
MVIHMEVCSQEPLDLCSYLTVIFPLCPLAHVGGRDEQVQRLRPRAAVVDATPSRAASAVWMR